MLVFFSTMKMYFIPSEMDCDQTQDCDSEVRSFPHMCEYTW